MRTFNFVAFHQPFARIAHSQVSMMFVGLRSQAKFLDLDLGLGFLGFAVFLGSFVNEFSKIHHPANRGFRIGCDFDQIQFGVLGDPEGFVDVDNADILTFWTDQTYLRNTNAVIYSEVNCADMLLLLDTKSLNSKIHGLSPLKSSVTKEYHR